MAKQRAALGRGLSALMGVEDTPEEVVATPSESEKEGNSSEQQGTAKKTPAKRASSTSTAKNSTGKTTSKVSGKTSSARSSAKSSTGSGNSKATGKTGAKATSKSASTAKKSASPKASPSSNATQENEPDSFYVDIELIIANPDQPRTYFDQEELEELADSIKKNGLLQPILVRKIGALYQIIAGERRWQACKMIGLQTVPIRVTEADDIKSIALAMIENIQRSDLNPMEEAYGYRMLMERNNMTQAELAEAVSKARPTVANTLRLLDLPEDAQQLLFEGTITAGHARAILSIPTADGRQVLTRRLVEQTITVREAENLARLLAGRKTDTPKRAPIPKQFKKVAKSLREALGTNVRVKTVKGKNKIEIEFKDEEELEQIFRKMVPNEE